MNTVQKPSSFTDYIPKLQIGDLYLFVNTNDETFIGKVICETAQSLTINKLNTETNGSNCGGKSVMPIKFIYYSYNLSSLVPGERYSFLTEKDIFEATFRYIDGITIHLHDAQTGIHSMPLVFIQEINKLSC